MASSPLPVVAGGAPELTVAAAPVVPVACACTSSTAEPAAADRPAYSRAATPMSAVEPALAVMVGLVPPPAVTGAVQTDSSVPSEAVICAGGARPVRGRRRRMTAADQPSSCTAQTVLYGAIFLGSHCPARRQLLGHPPGVASRWLRQPRLGTCSQGSGACEEDGRCSQRRRLSG